MYISACLKCHNVGESGEIVEVVRIDDDGDVCECGEPMHYVHTDRASGIGDGDYSHTSASLAINPCQAKAHRKLFPGIGIKKDGQLHFNSVKKQSDYLKQTGFQKHPVNKEY